MTRDEVRAAARRMVDWHRRFVGLFGRRESQEHSLAQLPANFWGKFPALAAACGPLGEELRWPTWANRIRLRESRQ